MISRLATVTIFVDNQEKSLEFWTERMGFEVRANHVMSPKGNWIEVAPKGSESGLVLYPRSMTPNSSELKPSIFFLCDDLEETLGDLKSRGVKFLDEPQKRPWGTYARFVDIDRNEFLIKSSINKEEGAV